MKCSAAHCTLMCTLTLTGERQILFIEFGKVPKHKMNTLLHIKAEERLILVFSLPFLCMFFRVYSLRQLWRYKMCYGLP